MTNTSHEDNSTNPPDETTPDHAGFVNTDGLMTPVQFVRTVGPQRAALLRNLEIHTAFDLLFHIPHSVNDFSDVRPVPRLEADVEQSVHGFVVDRDVRTLKNNRTLIGVLLNCNGHFVRGIWFNQPWMFKKFQDNDHVVFSGKPQRKAGRWEFSNPRIHILGEDDDIENAVGVLPRYALTDGIRMDQMRRMTRAVLEDFGNQIHDPLPESFRQRHRLPGLQTALNWLHQPPTAEKFQSARERVLLDDLLEFQLALALRRETWNQSLSAWPIEVSARVDARIRRLFDFRFTQGQNTAVAEIVADLQCTQPMHRLLQADVGAGKTAIAVYAMLAAVAAGFQAVLMAPTEVLASQHWETIDELLAASRVKRGFLIGGLPAAQKRELLADIESGATQLIIGTQAVIQESVRFNKLALAVIDEQHRFGVRQRAGFANAHPEHNPHVLVMTATPIPRSLCLTRFGDLDVSIIRELPPGRQTVVTSRIATSAEETRMWNFIRRQIDKGRQAYVVCPRIEGQSGDDVAAAETVFQRLRNAELAGLKVALLHGRMDREQRHDLMDQFRAGEIHVLVSTTVIEVGVNVPNATVMVIQQAERFGLAQLHQLRGRICRGSFQGFCFLMSQSDLPDAVERLTAMEQSADGFVLAEKDADLRGPGDVLGLRQSGALPLRVAHPVRDLSILQVARRMAMDLVESGEFQQPEFDELREIVLSRFANVLQLPQTG
ncbi:MAG: ATP-dependent DNA helicase RecG [Planctomycetaceae bacterium]|nr:ATP-dependent DNA helicase RecG [Planctomycetaceae bacterium]